ncbi:hypothetical protein HDU97_000854 [Phlyctochytrium planicorne]|nr:hypothetical protein HDU97_000854 [Phlyctochytrium planicorne]
MAHSRNHYDDEIPWSAPSASLYPSLNHPQHHHTNDHSKPVEKITSSNAHLPQQGSGGGTLLKSSFASFMSLKKASSKKVNFPNAGSSLDHRGASTPGILAGSQNSGSEPQETFKRMVGGTLGRSDRKNKESPSRLAMDGLEFGDGSNMASSSFYSSAVTMPRKGRPIPSSPDSDPDHHNYYSESISPHSNHRRSLDGTFFPYPQDNLVSRAMTSPSPQPNFGSSTQPNPVPAPYRNNNAGAKPFAGLFNKMTKRANTLLRGQKAPERDENEDRYDLDEESDVPPASEPVDSKWKNVVKDLEIKQQRDLEDEEALMLAEMGDRVEADLPVLKSPQSPRRGPRRGRHSRVTSFASVDSNESEKLTGTRLDAYRNRKSMASLYTVGTNDSEDVEEIDDDDMSAIDEDEGGEEEYEDEASPPADSVAEPVVVENSLAEESIKSVEYPSNDSAATILTNIEETLPPVEDLLEENDDEPTVPEVDLSMTRQILFEAYGDFASPTQPSQPQPPTSPVPVESSREGPLASQALKKKRSEGNYKVAALDSSFYSNAFSLDRSLHAKKELPLKPGNSQSEAPKGSTIQRSGSGSSATAPTKSNWMKGLFERSNSGSSTSGPKKARKMPSLDFSLNGKKTGGSASPEKARRLSKEFPLPLAPQKVAPLPLVPPETPAPEDFTLFKDEELMAMGILLPSSAVPAKPDELAPKSEKPKESTSESPTSTIIPPPLPPRRPSATSKHLYNLVPPPSFRPSEENNLPPIPPPSPPPPSVRSKRSVSSTSSTSTAGQRPFAFGTVHPIDDETEAALVAAGTSTVSLKAPPTSPTEATPSKPDSTTTATASLAPKSKLDTLMDNLMDDIDDSIISVEKSSPQQNPSKTSAVSRSKSTFSVQSDGTAFSPSPSLTSLSPHVKKEGIVRSPTGASDTLTVVDESTKKEEEEALKRDSISIPLRKSVLPGAMDFEAMLAKLESVYSGGPVAADAPPVPPLPPGMRK